MNITNIEIPEMALVSLVGVSGSGKSTFASKHFLPTEVISSDYCRAVVSDEEMNQAASDDAFDLLHYIARKRLKRGRLTVVDATNLHEGGRRELIQIAKEYHVLPIAIVLNIPRKVCENRHEQRTDRNFGKHVIRHQYRSLRRTIGRLKKEGFRYVYILDSEEEVNAVQMSRKKLYNNKKEITGPFDIIGDIHAKDSVIQDGSIVECSFLMNQGIHEFSFYGITRTTRAQARFCRCIF